MQEVFSNIIEELEIERTTANNTFVKYEMNVDLGRVFGLEKAIEIVKQEAEQFGTDTNVGSKGNDVLEFANLLKELCCKKDEDYDNPVISPKYLNDTIENLLLEFNEQCNNGWIPCSERLPEERDWYLAVFEEVDTGFIGIPYIAEYLMGARTRYTTKDGWIIRNCTDIEGVSSEYYKNLKCIAWQPLPEPYQPKGE